MTLEETIRAQLTDLIEQSAPEWVDAAPPEPNPNPPSNDRSWDDMAGWLEANLSNSEKTWLGITLGILPCPDQMKPAYERATQQVIEQLDARFPKHKEPEDG